MKKNIFWILSWTIVNILFSMANQYIMTLPTNSEDTYGPLWGWGDSIAVLFAGPILGIQGAIVFLLIDYFALRFKIKNKSTLFFLRILLVILIVVFISIIQKKYF